MALTDQAESRMAQAFKDKDTAKQLKDAFTAIAGITGPAAVVVALTDNSGGAAVNDVIAVVTAPTALAATLTDSSSFSGTHDDTVASVAIPVTLTDSTGDSGTHSDVLADGLTATAPAAITDYTAHVAGVAVVTSNAATDLDTTAAGLATLEGEVTALTVVVAACVTDLAVQNQNDSDLAQKVIELVTLAGVLGQNESDITQKVIELVTAQAADRAAIVALTDAVKELATKTNAILTSIKAVGVMAAA